MQKTYLVTKLISKTYSELPKLDDKITWPENGQKIHNPQNTHTHTHTQNKHIKECSTSKVIREMQKQLYL